LNQNRNNNRRRGRNNRGQGGGGNQGNRIDSRARGNAPQMLEKYKKLAHDASLNGDRVQTEYYLQFADHYFRVIADGKSQRDEQQHQRARHNDRDDDGEYEDDDRQPQRDQRGGRERYDRDERDERDDEGQRDSESETDSPDEQAVDNPFIRESKPRRTRPRKNGTENESSGLDPAILPPSIGNDDSGEAEEDERPRRRTRSRRVSDEEEAREAHG
jgi:hypothetical protein